MWYLEKWIYQNTVDKLMAMVRVRYFGMLREIVGKREERLEVDNSMSVGALITFLSTKHGQKFSGFMYDDEGKLRRGLAFAVNGDTMDSNRLSELKCKDVTEFVILPPISGG